MKILFVLNNFEIGGPQKSLLSLLHLLKKRYPNYELYLTVLNGSNTLNDKLPKDVNIIPTNNYIRLLMLDKRNILKNIVMNLNRPILIKNLFLLLLKKFFLKRDFTKLKQQFWIENTDNKIFDKNIYDYAIAVSGGHSLYYICDHITAKKRIGWIRTDYKVLKRDEKLDAKYFEKVNNILSVSKICADNFNETFHMLPTVFYNPSPLELYKNIKKPNITFTKDKINILSIMRLDPDKGLDLIIGSAVILKNKKLNFKWYIAGDGKQKKWLEKQIIDNNLNDYIKLLGFVFNTGYLIEKCDIVVHPSRFEGKANTIDEALIYNKVVLATNFETVYEQIIDDYNGFIVKMDEKEIAKKLIELFDDTSTLRDIETNIQNSKGEISDKAFEFINNISR